MLRDFTSQASDFHRARLSDWTRQARRDALLREAQANRRIRKAIGTRLIALGERIADQPARADHMVDRAA